MTNVYLDIFDMLRSTSGLETASLLGNAARLVTAQSAGATSLTVPTSGIGSVTVALNFMDRVTIFDGSSTEVVQVGSAGAAVGATSIPLLAGTSLQFSHGIGVAWCSDGISGSLADQIVNASAWIENTACNQPLLLTTWTNEELAMPTMRASIDNTGGLLFRPRHWPVQSLTSVSIATQPGVSISYDPTQVFIDSDKQICNMPYLQPLATQGQAPYPTGPSYDRRRQAQVTITYQAGYAYNALPGDLKEAAILVVSDLLAKRANPIGSDSMGEGKVHYTYTLRGDQTGQSLLMKRAMKTLVKYSSQTF